MQRFRPATRSRSSSSAALLLLFAALTGCGGSSPHSQQPTRTAAPGPAGHLSRDEYRAIEREYARLHPLERASDLRGAAAKAAGACRQLSQPNTRLVQLVRVDCLHAIRFFDALDGIQTAAGDCRGAACLATRYERLATALIAITQGGVGLNDELARRQITGLCAQSIGIRPKDLKALRAAAAAATGAADSIGAGDTALYQHYSKALDRAFAAQSSADALAGIRKACNPAKPAPRSGSGTTPAPKRARPAPHHRKHRNKGIAPGSGLNI